MATYFVGLDVHWKHTTICILDDHSKRVKRLTIRGAWPKIADELKQLSGKVLVCFEASTAHGYLYEMLSKVAERVVVALPTSFIPFLFTLLVTPLSAKEPFREEGVRRLDNVQYAAVDGHRLLLDLYIPSDVERPPLVVWVHGGAWRRGSKSNMPLMDLVKHGFAVASVDYRLSPVACFPAQIHDCKAAIRYLRSTAAKHAINADRIGVAGSSAGGHLAALIGVTNHHQELEGDLGDYVDQSSAVQAIVDYYGPTNFMTILKQSTPHGLGVRVPALHLLLGDGPEQKPALARLASPVFHVDSDDPPLLLIHGDQDPQVPINQSHELHAKYKRHQGVVTFEVVHGGAHGGNGFFDENRNAMVRRFFAKHLVFAKHLGSVESRHAD